MALEELAPGAVIHRAHLDRAEQAAMAADIRAVIAAAPLVRPVTRWGKPMSVRMTAAGRLGWVIDRGRYRYADCHPQTGAPWPPLPASVQAIWDAVSGWTEGPPECCLINWYDRSARMGLHQDSDENEWRAPVVSISLGDSARFRIGGTERGGKTRSTVLASGDVLVMGGASRLAYHGVDRVIPVEDGLFPDGGRINLTLRVVRPQSGPGTGG